MKSKEEKQKKGTEDEIDDGESVLNPKKDKKQKKKQPKTAIRKATIGFLLILELNMLIAIKAIPRNSNPI